MLDELRHKIDQNRWTTVEVSTQLPWSGAVHDLIVCSSVCSFIDDYGATVRQLVERLRPGGVFVQWDWERDEADADSHGLTRSEIADALAGAGLQHRLVDTAFTVLANDQQMSPLMGSGQRPLAASA